MGGKLEMVCAATGVPPPLVTLEKQSSSRTVTLKSATERARLTIDNLRVSDNGKYVCIAKNIAGDVEKAVLVEVKCKLAFLMSCIYCGNACRICSSKT